MYHGGFDALLIEQLPCHQLVIVLRLAHKHIELLPTQPRLDGICVLGVLDIDLDDDRTIHLFLEQVLVVHQPFIRIIC